MSMSGTLPVWTQADGEPDWDAMISEYGQPGFPDPVMTKFDWPQWPEGETEDDEQPAVVPAAGPDGGVLDVAQADHPQQP